MPLTHYTTSLLNKVVQGISALGKNLTAANNGSTVTVNFVAEPFVSPFAHSRGGAYPHSPSRQATPGPVNTGYLIDPATSPGKQSTDSVLRPIFNQEWFTEAQSAFYEFVVSSMKEFMHNIQAEAVAEGLSRWDDVVYPNHALADTPLELMYGSNVQQLREIAAKYDPDGIMKLTGGPHF